MEKEECPTEKKNMGIDDDDLRSIIPFMKMTFMFTISMISFGFCGYFCYEWTLIWIREKFYPKLSSNWVSDLLRSRKKFQKGLWLKPFL